jgi:hypothetical protein
MSYLHEWGTTAMFELGTVGGVLANEMGEQIWDAEVFQAYDHYSRTEKSLILIYTSPIIKTALRNNG